MRFLTAITIVPLLCGATPGAAQEGPRPEVLIQQALQELERRKSMVRILDLDASFPSYHDEIRQVGLDRGLIVSGRDELLECPDQPRYISDCGLPFEGGTLLIGFGEIGTVSSDQVKLPVFELFPHGPDSVRETHYDVIFERVRGSTWRVVDIVLTLVT